MSDLKSEVAPLGEEMAEDITASELMERELDSRLVSQIMEKLSGKNSKSNKKLSWEQMDFF